CISMNEHIGEFYRNCRTASAIRPPPAVRRGCRHRRPGAQACVNHRLGPMKFETALFFRCGSPLVIVMRKIWGSGRVQSTRNLSFSGFALMLGLMVALMVAGLSRMSVMNENLEAIVRTHNAKMALVWEMR